MYNKHIYAFNVCYEGFDQENEVKKHNEINHKGILIKISQNIENRESEYDKAFLARFNDDGNQIVLRINWSYGTVLLPPELLNSAVEVSEDQE